MYGYDAGAARRFDYPYGNYEIKREDVLKKQNVGEKADKKAQPKFAKAAARFLLVAAAFTVALSIVWGFVKIDEAEGNIADLKEELRMIDADNQAIKAKIDKSIDLKNLQTVASEKLGMVRPESYQIFYVNMDFEDYSEKPDRNLNGEKIKKDIPVESVTGVLISSTDMFR